MKFYYNNQLKCYSCLLKRTIADGSLKCIDACFDTGCFNTSIDLGFANKHLLESKIVGNTNELFEMFHGEYIATIDGKVNRYITIAIPRVSLVSNDSSNQIDIDSIDIKVSIDEFNVCQHNTKPYMSLGLDVIRHYNNPIFNKYYISVEHFDYDSYITELKNKRNLSGVSTGTKYVDDVTDENKEVIESAIWSMWLQES